MHDFVPAVTRLSSSCSAGHEGSPYANKTPMTPDEQAIREHIATWMEASRLGDTETVLGLMTDDIEFLVAGLPPFGKAEFAAMSRAMRGASFEGAADIREITIAGDWAWLRNHLDVTLTPPGGSPMHLAGPVLSILRKEGDRWRLARDANFVAPVA